MECGTFLTEKVKHIKVFFNGELNYRVRNDGVTTWNLHINTATCKEIYNDFNVRELAKDIWKVTLITTKLRKVSYTCNWWGGGL